MSAGAAADLIHPVWAARAAGNDVLSARLAAAAERAQSQIAGWRVADVQLLRPSHMSIVAEGRRNGERVVVKAPLSRRWARFEARALPLMANTPRLLAHRGAVLLLEHIDGEQPAAGDHRPLVEALRAIHGPSRPAVDARGLVGWRYWRGQLYEIAAATVRRRGNLLALVEQADVRLPGLLRGAKVVCHGDLQRKNLLVGPRGTTVIDPFGALVPAGYDAAFAAVSLALEGGDAERVLSAAEDLGIADARDWLPVCAVTFAGARNIRDEATCALLSELAR